MLPLDKHGLVGQEKTWPEITCVFTERRATESSGTCMSHLPSGFTRRSSWTLSFIQSFVHRRCLVWHSRTQSLKVCVLFPGEWSDIWKNCQPKGKWALFFRLFELVDFLYVAKLVGLLVCILLWTQAPVWYIFTTLLPFLTSLAFHWAGSPCQTKKCCYWTWQGQECWQSPGTTLYEWNTNRLCDRITVWGTRLLHVHTLWWPFLTALSQTKGKP